MVARMKHVAKFDSHDESDRANRAFYRSLSPQQRLDMLLTLIQRNVEASGEAVKGLARVCRVVELPRR
jgi:hypothetical protein